MPAEFDNWEVEITFKVTGRGRVGADGLVSCTSILLLAALASYC